MLEKDLEELEHCLDYHFTNPALLLQAMTHKSYLNEIRERSQSAFGGDNERLEFLGDAVLDLIISEDLLQNYPDTPEGELSKMKARIVSETALAKVAGRLNIGRYLRLGRGEEITQGRTKPSLLANALEAVLAAIYLDGGLKSASLVIQRIFKDEMQELLETGGFTDYKTELQEHCQRDYEILPTYTILRESGPDHQKTFEVQLSIKGKVYGQGVGRSKKEAEQQAACEALEKLKAG
ncbi:MAG TPA: ribonuclease III [Nitrospiria bacterium]|nr:ribonuclease III [Nitrospiria bacterium]